MMGHAYELGGDRWHTHCFSCYKCEKPLSCDSNFLVLGTGALICFACSDSCKNCGKKIDDLAIILASSNEAYCSDCFKCCKCGDKIEDLRYAKTKRGLFCIACHERLLEKRKHYEERKRRLKKQLPLIPDNSGGSNSDTTLPQPEPAIPERSSQRPLSPLKNSNPRFSTISREDASFTVSPNDNQRPISSVSSLAIPLDFSAATSASGDPATLTEKYESSDRGNNSTVRSNSESVVAQFLFDGDYMSTADEETEKATPKKHKSQLSIDDMLQITLDNDQDQAQDQDEDQRHEQNHEQNHPTDNSPQELLGLPKESKKVLLNRTPLRNSNDENLSKSPTAYRQGLVLNDEDIMNALNSPVRVKSQEDPSGPGLGILTPSKSKSSSNEDIVLGLPYDNMPARRSMDNSATSNTARSPPIFGHHRRTSSGNAKKLGRSLSLRSKSIMMNLRPKSKDVKNGTSTKNQDFDTHSGWGVTSSQSAGPSPSQQRITSKHQSDSTVYSQVTGTNGEQNGHKPSTSSASGVSVFRTPPLENDSSFSNKIDGALHEQNKSTGSAQAEEDKEETPTNNVFLRSDVAQMELTLRRLKVEVNQLQSTKMQLTHDIDLLKSSKESLQEEIKSLNNIKTQKAVISESVESFEPEVLDEWQERQAATASVATTAKPKFWKLFSGGKPQNAISSGSQNRFEISSPMLQNPNEFEDMKLMPVQNDKKSSAASSPSGTKEGSVLYGSTLVARCSFEHSEIPMIVDTCIRHIESKDEFLSTDGLYRKSGSQLLIEQTEALFAQWTPNDPMSDRLSVQLNQDIHAVTGILKRYLRKLPNPVFTFKVYEPLMRLVREQNLLSTLPLKSNLNSESVLYRSTLVKLTTILQQLPEQHYNLLKRLVRHINLVAQFSESNLMNPHNLCLVFAPGLIRDYSGEKDIIDMRERNYVVSFVISRHRDIFG